MTKFKVAQPKTEDPEPTVEFWLEEDQEAGDVTLKAKRTDDSSPENWNICSVGSYGIKLHASVGDELGLPLTESRENVKVTGGELR